MSRAPSWAPYVATLNGYDVVGEPGVHIGMPSTALTLVFALDEPLDVGWGDSAAGPARRRRGWSTLSGLHPAPAAIHHGARQRGVYLDLTLAGARALFGVPASSLAGELLEAEDVDPDWRHLPERLAGLDVVAATRVVAEECRAALARHETAAPARAELGPALAALTRGLPVTETAERVGFSRRHLQDLVHAETGVSPQQFRRLARFQRSHRLVRDGSRLADVAARCGYADQSHLTRDWVALAGCSPTEWRRRELPFVQDREPAAPAGSSHDHRDQH